MSKAKRYFSSKSLEAFGGGDAHVLSAHMSLRLQLNQQGFKRLYADTLAKPLLCNGAACLLSSDESAYLFICLLRGQVVVWLEVGRDF